MAFCRQWLLILFALVASGVPVLASSRQQRDFAAAAAAFQDGMWSRAEVAFARFIEKYPKSERATEAALMQAQAEFNQGKWLQAIDLLQAREPLAGPFADQYAYWIGEAQFTNADYAAAANTFAQLAGTFTNSEWRLNAVVNEGAAYAKLNQWARVQKVLQEPDGVFQEAARTNGADSPVLTGWLLLGQALLKQHQPAAAAGVLQPSAGFDRNPELDWRRLDLLCQAQLAVGRTNEALALTANLVETAARAHRPDLLAESVLKEAGILEQSGRLADAISVYEEDLTNAAPNQWQRQAIIKVAELSARQTNFIGAETMLANYQSEFPQSPELDSVVLELGELYLKNSVLAPSDTNDLPQARAYLDQFINTFTNSPLLGTAYLDRGWCSWIEGRWAASAADFRLATERLPRSADLAVAYFKLGDADLQLGDYTNALKNYQAVVDDFTNSPAVRQALGPQAYYQALRASLQLKDYSGASNCLAQILKIYPLSTVAEKGILLEGQALSDFGQPQRARLLFMKFEEVFPESPQLPEVELAIARTYEQEGNWPQAISVYNSWISRFTSDTKNRPTVEYARAWANFQAGDEARAFLLFTNFIAQFPTNGLAPVAQWWLGDYYYGRGRWDDAERNYKLLFQKWPSNPLADPAELMAGRSAMNLQDYGDAITYLTSLTGDTNCDPELDSLALFAYGDAEMQMPSPDTNNPLANFPSAINVFQIICQTYPGTDGAAHAWGEIGDCYFQLASQAPQYYGNATNAYEQVIISPAAGIAARSQAQLGIGQVYEKLAALDATNQASWLRAALDCYLDVFFGDNLRDGESADPFWVKEAGLHALPLVESLGTGDPNKFIDQMETVLPQLRNYLEKKRLELARPGA